MATSGSSQDLLAVRIDEDDGRLAVRVEGELELATASELESALLRAMESGAESILLDLERVSFIDSEGLRVLFWAARQSREDGDRLRIDVGSGHVRQMIELTRLEDSLPLTS